MNCCLKNCVENKTEFVWPYLTHKIYYTAFLNFGVSSSVLVSRDVAARLVGIEQQQGNNLKLLSQEYKSQSVSEKVYQSQS